MDEELHITDCRAAMLELNLSADGMAKLLGLPVTKVNQMCLRGERLPPYGQHKVSVLLNMHRYRAPRPPALDLRHDLLLRLGIRGVLPLEEAKQSGLSAWQIKNIETVDGYVRMVWNTTPTGLRIFIYLTLKGYEYLGLIMPEDGPFPPLDARPVEIKHSMNEVQASIIDITNKEIEVLMKRADDLRTIRWLAQSGYEDSALEMHEKLVGSSLDAVTKVLTNGATLELDHQENGEGDN